MLIETDAQTPLLHMVFHAGSAADPETLHMSLLLNILAGGDSSRLHRLLVEDQQSAIDVGAWQHEGFDPSVVYFYLTLPPGGDPAAVEATVLAELERVAAEGVTDAELAKAQSILLADYWRGLATIDGKAAALGEYEVFHGSYEKLFEHSGQVESVTADALQSVAAEVFRAANMTVGVLRAPQAGEDE